MSAVSDTSTSTTSTPRPGVPLNFFGMSFGLSGLAGSWSEAARALGAPALIAEVAWAIAAAVWIGTIAVYVTRLGTLRRFTDDLQHPVLGPFAALIPLPGMLLGAHLSTTWPLLGEILVWVMFVLSGLFGTWFISQLVVAPKGFAAMHGGFLLPTVAAGLVSAQTLATIGADQVAVAALGVGLLFWVLIGGAFVARLISGPEFPGGLLPTFAIFAAPPAVAGNAWWVLSGGEMGFVGALLAGTMVALVVPNLFLLPRYFAQPYTPGFWAFTFTAAASATFAVRLLSSGHNLLSDAAAWLIIGSATVLVGAIAVRTVLSFTRSLGTRFGRRAQALAARAPLA